MPFDVLAVLSVVSSDLRSTDSASPAANLDGCPDPTEQPDATREDGQEQMK